MLKKLEEQEKEQKSNQEQSNSESNPSPTLDKQERERERESKSDSSNVLRCKRCHKDLTGEEYLDLDKAQVLSPNPDQPRDPRLTGKICIPCDKKEAQEREEKQRKEQDTIKQKFSYQIE